MNASWLSAAGIALAGCDSLFTYPEIGFRSPGLGTLAAQRGKVYGAAVYSGQLDNEEFAKALKREVKLLVPEAELKWYAVHPSPDAYDFSGYHRLAGFARENGMAMRGHALAWHHANPKWLEPALTSRKTAEKILRAHIARVLAETSPMIGNWDVVNEAIDPHSPRADKLRETLWLKAIGPSYIPFAYRCAHEANPALTLVYNDYGFEYGDGYGRARRQATLRMLEKQLGDGVPIHALGLQSHLQPGRPMGGKEFTDFLREVRGLGLKVYVTELDLDFSRIKDTSYERVRLGQIYARTYLDMVQEGGPVNMLLTWGLSDRYTWLKTMEADVAGALPLDAEFNRSLLWDTLRRGWAEA